MSIENDAEELKRLMEQRNQISKRIRELQRQSYTVGRVRFCRDPYSHWHSWKLQVKVDDKRWKTAFEVRDMEEAFRMLRLVRADLNSLCDTIGGHDGTGDAGVDE